MTDDFVMPPVAVRTMRESAQGGSMTDLSPERLDEMERRAHAPQESDWDELVPGSRAPEGVRFERTFKCDEVLALIAMARAKQAAERERDAYLAIVDAKVAEVAALVREWDVLREIVRRFAIWDPHDWEYNCCNVCGHGGSRADDHHADCVWAAARRSGWRTCAFASFPEVRND